MTFESEAPDPSQDGTNQTISSTSATHDLKDRLEDDRHANLLRQLALNVFTASLLIFSAFRR